MSGIIYIYGSVHECVRGDGIAWSCMCCDSGPFEYDCGSVQTWSFAYILNCISISKTLPSITLLYFSGGECLIKISHNTIFMNGNKKTCTNSIMPE